MSGPHPPHIRLREDHCPYCGKMVDSLCTLEGEPPFANEGDLVVCFGCAEIMQFGADLRMKKMTMAEIAALSPEELADMKQTQDAIRSFLANEKRP